MKIKNKETKWKIYQKEMKGNSNIKKKKKLN